MMHAAAAASNAMTDTGPLQSDSATAARCRLCALRLQMGCSKKLRTGDIGVIFCL